MQDCTRTRRTSFVCKDDVQLGPGAFLDRLQSPIAIITEKKDLSKYGDICADSGGVGLWLAATNAAAAGEFI